MKTKSIGLWVAAIGPMTLLAGGLLYGAWQEASAWTFVRQQFQNRIETALQEENAAKLNPVRSTQASEDEDDFLNAMNLKALALVDRAEKVDLLLTVPDGAPLDTGIEWPEAPIAERLMDEAEPIFAKLSTMQQEERKPEYGFLLNAPAMLELLETSLRVSIHNNDFEKAARALSILATEANQYPIAETAGTQIHYIRLHARVYRLYQQTLFDSRWTPAQLDALSMLILKPLRIEERLRYAQERSDANTLDYLISQIGPTEVFNAPRLRVDELRWFNGVNAVYLKELISVSRSENQLDNGSELQQSLVRTSQRRVVLASNVFSFSAPGGQNANYSNANAVVSQVPKLGVVLGTLENHRRLLSLAVAAKKHQLENGHFPSDLKALVVGDVDHDLLLTTVLGGSFAYSVHRIADSDEGHEAATIQCGNEFNDSPLAYAYEDQGLRSGPSSVMTIR